MKGKQFTQNTGIDVNIKGIPEMARVGELDPNDVFFCRRNSCVRVVVGSNCYEKEILEKYEEQDGKKLVVYYDLSQKNIGTIDADEWVVVGNRLMVSVE